MDESITGKPASVKNKHECPLYFACFASRVLLSSRATRGVRRQSVEFAALVLFMRAANDKLGNHHPAFTGRVVLIAWTICAACTVGAVAQDQTISGENAPKMSAALLAP